MPTWHGATGAFRIFSGRQSPTHFGEEPKYDVLFLNEGGRSMKKNVFLVAAALSALWVGAAPGISTGCVPPPSGLVGWWPGEGNAKDIVGAMMARYSVGWLLL
jgi:hypothetical protein